MQIESRYSFYYYVQFNDFCFKYAAETGSQLKEKVLDNIGRYYPDRFDVTAQNGIVTIGDVNTLYDKFRIFDMFQDYQALKI